MNRMTTHKRIHIQEVSVNATPNLKSTPIIQIANFLPKHERNNLFKVIGENQQAFKDISASDSVQRTSLYCSLESEISKNRETQQLREACSVLSIAILNLLPKIFTALDIDPFPVSHIPFTIINGQNSHSGNTHIDTVNGLFSISMLYYFHKKPKAFKGGDLNLFDTDESSYKGYSDKPFAKIEHEDNLFIAFPSNTYHGISSVQLNSNNFEDGRFVAVGFIGPQK